MAFCIYTTNRPYWMDFLLDHCPREQAVWFRSNKRWAAAKERLNQDGPCPIFIRITKEDDEDFVCHGIAELIAIRFLDKEFESEAERRDWLYENLEFQRTRIFDVGMLPKFKDESEQFQTAEVEKGLEAKTLYRITNAKRLSKPIPISDLTKWKDGSTLSPDFKRGYAICDYPKADLEKLLL